MLKLDFQGEEIRFKVVAEDFNDTTPSGPNNESPETSLESKDNKKMAYRITVNKKDLYISVIYLLTLFSKF